MKKVWKSVVATLALTTLSLGLLPGNLAESAGLAVESKAASGYHVEEDPNNAYTVAEKVGYADNFDEVSAWAIPMYENGTLKGYDDREAANSESDPNINHYYIYGINGSVNYDEEHDVSYANCYMFYSDEDAQGNIIVRKADWDPEYASIASTWGPEVDQYSGKWEKSVYHLVVPNSDTGSFVVSSGNAGSSPVSTSNYIHTHNYSWVVDMDASMEKDGEALYRCSCGDVKYRQPIPASEVYVKNLYGDIRLADQGATVTFDAKKNSCISDYIIGILAQRSDVTTTITFEYKNAKYQFTIPAGTDFTSLLNDDEKFYGFFGFCGKLGIPVNQI